MCCVTKIRVGRGMRLCVFFNVFDETEDNEGREMTRRMEEITKGNVDEEEGSKEGRSVSAMNMNMNMMKKCLVMLDRDL